MYPTETKMREKIIEIRRQYSKWTREQLIQEHDSLREIEKILRNKRPLDTEVINYYSTKASNISYIMLARDSEQRKTLVGWETITLNATEEGVNNIIRQEQMRGYETKILPSPTKTGRFDVYRRKK